MTRPHVPSRRNVLKIFSRTLFCVWVIAAIVTREWHFIGIGLSFVAIAAAADVEIEARELEK